MKKTQKTDGKGIQCDAEFTIVKSLESSDGQFHIVGYAATHDFDLHGDVISDKALSESAHDLENNSTVLFNHDDNLPIGRVVKQSVDAKGILIDAILDKTAVIPAIGTRVVDAVKQGILNKFSVRLRVLDAAEEFVSHLGRVANVIKRMLLLEASLVSVPANPEARTLSWYISKALYEHEHEGDSKVNEAQIRARAKELGLDCDDETPIETVKSLIATKEAEIEAQKKSDENADGKKSAADGPKGFPDPATLRTEWGEHCTSKGLNAASDKSSVDAAWGEFCREKKYPEGFPYPYPSEELVGLKQLADQIAGLKTHEMKSVSTVAAAASAHFDAMLQKSIPLPGIVVAAPAEPEQKKSDDGKTDDPNTPLIQQLSKQIADLSAANATMQKRLDDAIAAAKKPDDDGDKNKNLDGDDKKSGRRGVVGADDGDDRDGAFRESRKKLDGELSGKPADQQLRELLEMEQELSTEENE